MTRIDAFKINEVMTKAKLIYQKKTFGGISSESAHSNRESRVTNLAPT